MNTTIFQHIFKNKNHVGLSSNQRFLIKLNPKSSRLLLSIRAYVFWKIWKYSACVSKLFEVDEFILVSAYRTSRFFYSKCLKKYSRTYISDSNNSYVILFYSRRWFSSLIYTKTDYHQFRWNTDVLRKILQYAFLNNAQL